MSAVLHCGRSLRSRYDQSSRRRDERSAGDGVTCPPWTATPGGWADLAAGRPHCPDALNREHGEKHYGPSEGVVNAVSNFLTCAEVKFPRPPISVISRQGDHELRFWEADRDGAEAVLGLAH